MKHADSDLMQTHAVIKKQTCFQVYFFLEKNNKNNFIRLACNWMNLLLITLFVCFLGFTHKVLIGLTLVIVFAEVPWSWAQFV